MLENSRPKGANYFHGRKGMVEWWLTRLDEKWVEKLYILILDNAPNHNECFRSYKHTTYIPRGNDVETNVAMWNTRRVFAEILLISKLHSYQQIRQKDYSLMMLVIEEHLNQIP